VLQVGLDRVNRDISYVRNQAKTNIKKYIDERLPEEYALVHASVFHIISPLLRLLPSHSLNVESLVISIDACVASNLAATATIGEVKNFIREKIEEKKKKIHKPEIVSQAYVDRILAELEILQMVMAEIYDIVGERIWLKSTRIRKRKKAGLLTNYS
jgi:hypothetical protein